MLDFSPPNHDGVDNEPRCSDSDNEHRQCRWVEVEESDVPEAGINQGDMVVGTL